jgi:hypothetical protein
MNLKLKLKIIEKYGGQWRFAPAVDEHESVISKVIRGRKELSNEKKRIWAKALECRVRDIFNGSSNS